MFRYLRAFLPWIAFTTISNYNPKFAAFAAFGLAVVLALHSRKGGAALDALMIEISSAVFFGGLALAAYTVSPKPLGVYATAAAAGWLAVTAWGSVAVRRPFTLGIARDMAPPEMHNDPRFYKLNAVLTTGWAIAFSIESVALAAVLKVAPHNMIALIIVKAICLGAPALFTARYPEIMAKKAKQQLLQHQQQGHRYQQNNPQQGHPRQGHPHQQAYPQQGYPPPPEPHRAHPTNYPPTR